MGRVRELEKEKRYAEALSVVDEVLRLQPDNAEARGKRDTLETMKYIGQQAEAARQQQEETVKNLVDIELSRIPWYELLTYPTDWTQISQRREKFGVTGESESEADRAVRQKLAAVVPTLKFDAQPFEDVISFLKDISGINIDVKWRALEAAGIDRSTQITVALSDVAIEKALRVVLEAAGGVQQLSYVVDEGVLTISTKEDLSKKVYPHVYDIRDLVVRVPNFTGPRLDLNATTGNTGNNGTGTTSTGLFGNNNNTSNNYTGGGNGNNNNGGNNVNGEGPSRAELTVQILDLIRSTIDPESWRNGPYNGTVGSIQELNGQIVVTQTADNHAQLATLLTQLREARALQVNIEARFILVNANFLNDIGVNLNFFFNLGSNVSNTGTLDPITGARLLNNTGTALPQWTGLPGGNNFTAIPVTQGGSSFTNPGATPVPGSIGGSVLSPAMSVVGSFLDDVQVDFLLRATQADSAPPP